MLSLIGQILSSTQTRRFSLILTRQNLLHFSNTVADSIHAVCNTVADFLFLVCSNVAILQHCGRIYLCAEQHCGRIATCGRNTTLLSYAPRAYLSYAVLHTSYAIILLYIRISPC